MSAFVITSVIAIFIWLCISLWRKFWLSDYEYSAYLKIPGPKMFPIIGNAMDYAVPYDKFLDNWWRLKRDHGPVFKLMFGSIPVGKKIHFTSYSYSYMRYDCLS